jgi:cholesterol oxidase
MKNTDSTDSIHPDSTIDRRSVLKALTAAAIVAATTKSVEAGDDFGNVHSSSLPIISRRKPCSSELNQIAASDYCESLSQFNGRLSNPIRQLFLTADKTNEVQFSVIIVGSGYGASICATRLSKAMRQGNRIGILERGKEWTPGTFPDTFQKVWGSSRQQMTGPTKGQVVNPLGLYNISFNDEVNILSGSALGGTSIVNANVALRPHRDTFDRPHWPAALRDIDVLTPYYDLAARQLSLSRTPVDSVPKLRTRRYTAQSLSSNPNVFDRSPVAVMYDQRYLDGEMRNPQGMRQRICTQCGDCITGCNVGAKNTLVYNYLPVAKWNGTEMYTQVQVDRIEREYDYYRLHLTYIDDTDGQITRHPLSITSKIVVVGAGSPGSAEILLQSQTNELQFSPALGKRWSANGDTIGFVVDMNEETRVGGVGTCDPNPCPVGTTVQSTLNFYDRPGLENKFIVQDAALPRGVATLFSILLGDRDLTRSMVMLGMGHDEAKGEVVWKDGRYQISWKGLKDSRFRMMMFREFERIAQAEGGRYKRLKAFGDNLVTVHPLGGCAMADDPYCGVVNDLGQVFDVGGHPCGTCTGIGSESSPRIHPGLYIADGSIIPTALGANPYLTICAVAERIAAHLISAPEYTLIFEQPASGGSFS